MDKHKKKNIVLGLALFSLVVLFYLITIIKL